MEATQFIRGLEMLTGDDILDVAEHLRAVGDTADGELAWWRATVQVGESLRRQHRGREAALLAHRAVEAVKAAAVRGGIDLSHRPQVTAVARAAAESARALVAGDIVPASLVAV